MKKNKKILIICIVIVVLLLVGVVGFLLFGKDDEFKLIEPNLEWGVVTKREYFYDEIIAQVKDMYVVQKDDKAGIVDRDGKVIQDIKYDAIMVDERTDTYYMYEGNRRYYINHKGDTVFQNNNYYEVIVKEYSEEYYYVLYSNNKTILYDCDGKLVKQVNITESIEIVNDYLITDTEIINLKSNEVIKFKYRDYSFKDYIVFTINNKKYMLYDKVNNKFTNYTSYQHNQYAIKLSDDSNVLIMNYDGNIVDDFNKNIINKNLYLDYSKCKNGFNAYLNNKVVDDTCYNYYEETTDKKAIGLFTWEDKSKIIFSNAKVKDFDSKVTITGNFIIYKDTLYFSNGEKTPNVCVEDLVLEGNGHYLCYTRNSVSIYDDTYNKVSDSYDTITCSDELCVVGIDHRYGVYSNGTLIIEPKYYDANILENNVILNKIFSIDVLSFGNNFKVLSQEELKMVENTKYQSVDVDKVLKDNSLLLDKELVKKNKDLFQKYAYAVLNNPNVATYEKDLLNMFIVVADNKDSVDEYLLIKGLKKLSIEKVKKLGLEGAAGVYKHINTSIEVLDDRPRVLYHEIMHFFDYNFNYNKNVLYGCTYNNVDYYGVKYDNLSQSIREECSEKVLFLDNSLLVEAATEYYSGIYMRNYVNDAYERGVIIFGTLNYLLGEDFGKKSYYGEDGFIYFYEEITKYLSVDEFEEFSNNLTSLIKLGGKYSDKNLSQVIASLIKIYEKSQTTDWQTDTEFLFLLSNIRGANDLTSPLTSQQISKISNNYGNVLSIINKLDGDKYSIRILPVTYIRHNGKSYIVANVYQNSNYGHVVIDYDFKNRKVISYKFYLNK